LVNLETESSMTSVLNSATSAAHHAKKAEKLSHSKASGLDTEGANGADGEFGALFGAMMGGLGGQNLAAPEGKASPPTVGLAAQILGPAVHIITASTPALSDDSLYAFARSQGMDEDALALIFQKPGPALMPTDAGDADLAAGLDGLDGLNALPGKLQPAPQLAADRLVTALTPEEKAMASVLSQTGSATRPLTESLDLGEDASMRWTLGKAADGLPTSQLSNQSNFFGLNGLRNLMPAAAPVQAAAIDPAAHPESAHQNLAASLILGAPEAAQFARRLEMKQASQRAERVAPGWLPPTVAGTGPTMPNDLSLIQEEVKIATLETLVIAPEIAPEDMSELLAGRSHGSEGRTQGSSESATTNNTNSAPRPDQAQRTEQYERLSQRLGEALGQRLAAQIAKGDWRVDLALKPHELGNIDIELQMKDGTLQASFSAGQAMTRELIADSLPRLKEILGQLGMDVATMDVNVRQNSQNGGNPTPGRSSSGSGNQAGKDKTEKAGEVSTSMAAQNISKGPDGLDVLV
jgi:flagellar hook-length control protein FliK